MREHLRYIDLSTLVLLLAVSFVAITACVTLQPVAALDGAGPVLEEALAAGWRPGPVPQRHIHTCDRRDVDPTSDEGEMR